MMMSDLNLQDKSQGGNAHSSPISGNNKLILMLLSQDLRKTYMKPLVDRLYAVSYTHLTLPTILLV